MSSRVHQPHRPDPVPASDPGGGPRLPTRPRSPALVLLLALALVGAGGHPPSAARSPRTAANAQTPAKASWKAVDALIGDQRYKAAHTMVLTLLESAAKRGDAREQARALIKATQLETALGGFEKAVRFLRSTPWPAEPALEAQLDLAYANALRAYLDTYSWQIGPRERVISTGEIDISKWTRRQILDQINLAFFRAWQQRRALGGKPATTFSQTIVPGSYPPRIRGTVLDAVTYLWTDFLANRSYWLPGQANEIYRLDLESLAAGAPGLSVGRSLADAHVHPLIRLSALLGALERWHRRRNEPEAALEARLRRLEILDGAVERPEDRRLIRRTLAASLKRFDRSLPWWSWGQATLATFYREDGAPDALVRARATALQGARTHPASPGGLRCRAIVASIERPDLSLAGMSSDGPGKRSLKLTVKNVTHVFFRAWRIHIHRLIARSDGWSLLPDSREVERVRRRAPDASWDVVIPAAPDYRNHVTWVTPPMTRPGLWVVMASIRKDFSPRNNVMKALRIILGDPVLLIRRNGLKVEAQVLSGSSGTPIAGATVTLYRLGARPGQRILARVTTGTDGIARFELHRAAPVFFLAEKDGQIAVEAGSVWPRRARAASKSSALLFTDRAIYRPGQELDFKVVAYEGDPASGRFHVRAFRPVKVTLRDANGREAASALLTTGSFGSADGRFTIPKGRLLGRWRLESSLGGSASILVEAYKRPTFTVTILPPTRPLRLNRPAELRGQARYYFGLPLSAGTVRWRVERVPVWPRWWGWWFPIPRTVPETIAAGTASLDAHGRFAARFTPTADERLAASGVTYRYRLVAEVTGEGGETRTATKSFRLGFVAVEASMTGLPGFLRPGTTATVTITRTDLDGHPEPGRGSWTLVRLRQPGRTPLPAEIPLKTRPDEPPGAFHTPGDRLRPRWDTALSAEQIMDGWPDGPAVAHGTLEHGAKGTATLTLRHLDPGAYRLIYTTRDPFGATASLKRIVVVARRGMLPLRVPLLLRLERRTVSAGGSARILVHSGLPGQPMTLEIFRNGRQIERRALTAGKDPQIIELPITAEDQGGLAIRLTAVRDHQLMRIERHLDVPWASKDLHLTLSHFSDTMRPGAHETFSVTVTGPDGKAVAENAAEVLALMYDASLDLFAPYPAPEIRALYPRRDRLTPLEVSLASAPSLWRRGRWHRPVKAPSFHGARLVALDAYGIGGMGWRGRGIRMFKTMGLKNEAVESARPAAAPPAARGKPAAPPQTPRPPVQLRSNFAETALWQPHLLTGPGGSVTISFDVPDSVTSWNLWVWAMTRTLEAGRLHRTARSVKDLMVRPYLPRFFREGDRARLRVAVTNAGTAPLDGTLVIDILDPDTNRSLAAAFGLGGAGSRSASFHVAAGKEAILTFPLSVPARVGLVAFKAVARANGLSDGVLRPLPILPGRYHLMQSRFVTLTNDSRRTLSFPGMASTTDPTRINEQLVVTVDAQLFTSVLKALPSLLRSPYHSTEQILDRFLSTAIVSKVFEQHPAVAKLAKKLSRRTTRLEPWNRPDPNRRMLLEETPWLVEAEGGGEKPADLIRLLDPDVATAIRASSLAELARAQAGSGGFPWWPGGPPSPFMTCYIVDGLSRALAHHIAIPKPMVVRAWRYLHDEYVGTMVRQAMAKNCCWQTITYLNYVLSNFPDPSWTGDVFTPEERRKMLELSFAHWRQSSPRIKGYLAMTLERAGRHADATRVFASVMDSSITDPELGTYWQPEARSWLWYNDTTESQALALRVLTVLDPADPRREGLVHWLLLDKKLNQWKSTRTTAEVIYALVSYMEREGSLGATQTIHVAAGPRSATFVFAPDQPVTTGQLVIPGDEMVPAQMSTIDVTSRGKGFAFAGATWSFSTEKEPAAEPGSLFSITRTFYRRIHRADGWVLEPLAEGGPLAPGDEVEVHLDITARHRAEYVHLHDPRPAGMEPATLTSGYRWIGGLGVYQEIRDSGADFFIEHLPAGTYTLVHRLRAATAGRFHTGPATLQCLYAPQFATYSSGAVITVGESGG
ncbi:MAG: hypothetical protein GXP48_02310 [Acidobacteria bacterium]|nr:hypothetical protein [Acidobacteriota bacterium]